MLTPRPSPPSSPYDWQASQTRLGRLPNNAEKSSVLVVGIDMGLTCTGVAYTMVDPEIIDIKHIYEWPCAQDQRGFRRERKVPTALKYMAGIQNIISWGFAALERDNLQGMKVIKNFKLCLDKIVYEGMIEARAQSPKKRPFGNEADIQKWYVDFLSELYNYILDSVVNPSNPDEVRFVLSFPAIYTEETVKKYLSLVEKAGFGSISGHSVEITLTEAEAAAIYTVSKGSGLSRVDSSGDTSSYAPNLKKGDVLLMCDSGGGTTDISIVQVQSISEFVTEGGKTRSFPELRILAANDSNANGILTAVGSTQIDRAFKKEVIRRLQVIPRSNEFPPFPDWNEVAERMVQEDFLNVKKLFGPVKKGPSMVNGYSVANNESMARGDSVTMEYEEYYFRVQGLPRDFNYQEASVRNGYMVFTRAEIQRYFDGQVHGVLSLIEEQLHHIDKLPSYLVLSGGLGSSLYLQSRVLERYGPAGKGMQVLVAKEPQLTVCKGLVIDYVGHLMFKRQALVARQCRQSYGILIHERCDKTNPSKIKNPLDGYVYIHDQIKWLLFANEDITRSVKFRFHRLLDFDQPMLEWEDIIVVCPAQRLPANFWHGGADEITEIRSELPRNKLNENVPGVQRVKRFSIPPKVYWRVELEVRVFVYLHRLKFEMWMGDDRIGMETSEIPAMYVAGMNTSTSSKDLYHEGKNKVPGLIPSEIEPGFF